jgi:drug/metabolite transporter (DMT)-like permease
MKTTLAHGYAMTAVSAALYSCTMLLLRLATDAGAPSVLSVAARYGFQTLVYSGRMLAVRMPILPSTIFGRRMLLATTLLICTGSTGYMFGSALAPLGDAGAISGTYPAGTLLIARLWLHEPLGLTGVPSILLCALGVAIISHAPSDAADAGGSATLTQAARHTVMVGYFAGLARSGTTR